VARLIYAVMALALGALVSGFFVSTSNVPLFLSIGLSAAVMLLILFGWSRRIRRGMDLFDERASEEEMEDLDVVEIEPDEFRPPAVIEVPHGREVPDRRKKAPPQRAVKAPVKAGVKKKAPVKAGVRKKAPARPSSTRVLVIPGRSRFHRPGCRFVKSDEAREVSEATARRRGYEPCSVCSS
jgi:hypothetical protein